MGRAPGGPVPVVIMGLGIIGQQAARSALASPEVELVGAVDARTDLAGTPLSSLLGDPATAIKVSPDLARALGRRRSAVVIHATGSRFEQVKDQLHHAVERGCPVVSSCEELAFPWLRHPEWAQKLDRAAQKAEVSVVGTGVNPGFVMDRLVAALGQACGPVRHALAERVVDASTRRPALQKKVGVGLEEDAFDALLDQDLVGHVGLLESCALAALGLGMDCDDFEEELVPVVADEDLPGAVKKGQVAGIFQTAVGLEEGQERVRLELTIAVGVERPGDRIRLDADLPLELEIRGGVPGDRATGNLLVNAAPRLFAAEPGLLTVLELPAGR